MKTGNKPSPICETSLDIAVELVFDTGREVVVEVLVATLAVLKLVEFLKGCVTYTVLVCVVVTLLVEVIKGEVAVVDAWIGMRSSLVALVTKTVLILVCVTIVVLTCNALEASELKEEEPTVLVI